MAVSIQQIADNKILVNGKTMYQDMQGNWIAPVELTTNEMQAFQEHIKVEDVMNNEKAESSLM